MAAPAVYLCGQTVSVIVNLPVDTTGALIPLSDINYTVTDDQGVVIIGATDVAVPTDGSASITITVPGADNILPPVIVPESDGSYPLPANSIGLRQVVTTFTAAATGNEFFDTESFIIKPLQPLVRMVNTFITWPETLLVRYQMPSLPGWDGATDDERIAALITAQTHMLQLRFRFPIGENFQSRIVDFYGMSVDNVFGRIFMVLADIAFYTDLDFQGWPYIFTNALKRAQMAEADNLLGGDVVGDKRNDGIVSETVGESSMRFRSVPEIVTPVCKAAMTELKGYLNQAVISGRGG